VLEDLGTEHTLGNKKNVEIPKEVISCREFGKSYLVSCTSNDSLIIFTRVQMIDGNF